MILASLISGLIPIVGGIYGLLLATGVLPSHPRDPDKAALWRKKFAPLMMILGPLLIIVGIIRIFAGF